MRSTADFASFSVTAHYALARVILAAAAAGMPREPPSTIPDIRSLFLGFHYSFAKLPDTPMRPRLADARIGYFGTDVWDFTTDARRIPIVHYVNRWRLEKKDPAAALSEPKQPIVFWIDRTVPVKYRDAIKRGRARVEQGVRAHRLQGRDQGGDPARRRRLRHAATSATRRSAG